MAFRERTLAGLAVLALVLGVACYLVLRDPAQLALLSQIAPPRLAAPAATPGWLGWMPSFLHCLGFALLIGAVVGLDRLIRASGAILAWTSLEALFEFGQHPALTAALASRLSEYAPDQPAWMLVGYFAEGTFDRLDLAAVVLAGVVALALVLVAGGKENRHVR